MAVGNCEVETKVKRKLLVYDDTCINYSRLDQVNETPEQLDTSASNNKHLKDIKGCCRRKMQDIDDVYALGVTVGVFWQLETYLTVITTSGKSCRYSNRIIESQPYRKNLTLSTYLFYLSTHIQGKGFLQYLQLIMPGPLYDPAFPCSL